MDLRPYLPTDRDACLSLFDSNMPRFFAEPERAQFETFLASPDCSYFVMEHEERAVGCGGYAIHAAEKSASLVWGMVRGDSHRMGLGRFLLLYRLREIGKAGANGRDVKGDIEMVRLDTSQHAAPFYTSQGFKVAGVVADGYGPGLDRIEMVKRMIVCG